jgi:hypothetical protein
MSTKIDDSLVLEKFPGFNNTFKKEDYHRVPPTNGIDNVNRPGNIVFRCNNKHMLLALFNSLIKVKLILTGIGVTMTLEHNAVLRMFEAFKLMFGSNTIEHLPSVAGDATTAINFVTTSDTFRRTYGALSGWIPCNHKDADDAKNKGFVARKNFYNKDKPTLFIPLSLIFGFTDYKKVLHLIDNISLTLSRKSDAAIVDDIFFGTAKMKNTATPPVDVNPTISFEDIEWWIPNLTPNLEAETFFEKHLKENKEIDMSFMKRHTDSVKFSSTKYAWTITGITKQVRHIFIWFKLEAPNLSKNNSLFWAAKIRSLQIRINGQLYPIQPMKFNFEQGDVAEPYLAYIESCYAFNYEPQLNIVEFRDLYPVFCFNTSAQNEILKNGNEAFVLIEKEGNDLVEIFTCCLEDCHLSYNLNNDVVSDV